ncbi:DUF6457 domain-containing protein [Sinomonas atrocyanea]
MSDPEKDALLRAWCAELTQELGLGDLDVDIDAVLGLAGVAAHSVVRPAAPSRPSSRPTQPASRPGAGGPSPPKPCSGQWPRPSKP